MGRKIKKIYLHCSDSDDSLDFDVKDINDWHKQRGFESKSGINVGYHYVIKRDGTIQEGRPDSETGAHVKGDNRNSIGICLIGRNKFSNMQINSAFTLIRKKMKEYDIDISDVYGHYEKDPGKTCPNLDMTFFRANLLFVFDVDIKKK